MKSAEQRNRELVQIVRDLSQHIQWILPFMNAKAKESGDVAGMQANAKAAADEAIKRLNFYEAEDRLRSEKLAK
jgi:hypothetical protein